MDREEQTRLFHQRMLPFRERTIDLDFVFEFIIAIMNDFPLDITDENGRSILHHMCILCDPEQREMIPLLLL